MKLNMIKGKRYGIEEIRQILLVDNVEVSLDSDRKEELYKFIEDVLTETRYLLSDVKRKDKILVFKFLRKVSGLSKVQLKRLIKVKRLTGFIKTNYDNCNKFKVKYKSEDIKLLVQTDNDHNRRNGFATKENLRREFNIYNKKEFSLISEISVSHLYNLRKQSPVYKKEELTFTKTNPVSTPIGTRKKPNNEGKPGFLRVDSVHQGDKGREKGVYYINIVDEVTQWNYVACVEGISEYFLYPVLQDLIEKFPFRIENFHSDNGSEYINCQVAELLKKLAVSQTKSRSRHSNDNGLVESKNSSIIRKRFGYAHIPKTEAENIEEFLRKHFDEYLNYHRICHYPTKIIDSKGKEKIIYKEHTTPFRKLISIPNYEIYLKPEQRVENLFVIELKMSDNESGRALNKDYAKLQLEIIRRIKGISGIIL